jgi:ribosomal protein L35AE/L33A
VYVKGKHLSYQRGKRNTNPNTSLVKIEGVEDPKAAQYVRPQIASKMSCGFLHWIIESKKKYCAESLQC